VTVGSEFDEPFAIGDVEPAVESGREQRRVVLEAELKRPFEGDATRGRNAENTAVARHEHAQSAR
jgi:hypothetical protein